MNAYDNSPLGGVATEPSDARKPLGIGLGILAALLAGAAVVSREPVVIGLAASVMAGAALAFVLRHPPALLWTLILTAPFNDWSYLGINAGDVTVRPYGALVPLGIAAILILLLVRAKSELPRIAWYFRGTLLVFALFIVSKLLTVYALRVLPPHMTKLFLVKYVIFVALQAAAGFVCACFIESPARLRSVIRVWIHLANVVCLVAVAQLIISNVTHYSFVWHREIFPLGRPYSIFREPDVLGTFLAAMITMLVPLLVARVSFVARAYLWFSLGLHAILFVMLFARAAWVAVIISTLLYVILTAVTGRQRRLAPYLNGLMAVVLLAAVGLVVAAPAVAERMLQRLESVSNPKSESGSAYRLLTLKEQYDLVFHPPAGMGGMTQLLGYGDFSFSYWGPYLMPDDYDQSIKALKPGQVIIADGFCMILSVLFDNGIVGAALYGVFFLALAAHFLHVLSRTQDSETQAVLIGTFLPVVAILICYQFSYDPLFLTQWILLGVHMAALYHARENAAGGGIVRGRAT